MLTSQVCRAEDFRSPWLRAWERALRDDPAVPSPWLASPHRKLWEWCAIAQALEERDMLRPGRQGIGFAVGQEPLTAAFAARGVSVLATDGPDAGRYWGPSDQHAGSAAAVFRPALIDHARFAERVRFQPVDMRDLAALPAGRFDFLWSACALEHLGSLAAGLTFVAAAMRLLRPGGVAVHTTEYNISSNDTTVESGDNVIYRRRDLIEFSDLIRFYGAAMLPIDFDAGQDDADLAFDVEPYYTHGRPHVKLLLHGFVSTSILLVLRQGERPPMEVTPPAPAPPAPAPPALCLPRRLWRRCRRLFAR